jgi:hypothetical protein
VSKLDLGLLGWRFLLNNELNCLTRRGLVGEGLPLGSLWNNLFALLDLGDDELIVITVVLETLVVL